MATKEESVEYGRGRAWQILQKYSLRFAAKECPGEYLEERMFDIAAKVNALL